MASRASSRATGGGLWRPRRLCDRSLVVPAALALPLPPAFGFEAASAFICTYATSHHALLDRAALQPGETVLILGEQRGVGTAALQIAKAAGARVIAAASSATRSANAWRHWAPMSDQLRQRGPARGLKRLTGGAGPDVIYDPVGGDLAEPAFRSIAWRGRYLVVGFAQGQIPALPLNLPLLRAPRSWACSGVNSPNASPPPTARC